ncbi:hypothetical protein AN640_05270 [Candidatus Epulonipiscium fishelsonii]|uniref:Uncharacterized protein n=1 Tax=Candidatus Epulonipiscium fishelsonii TaxID=77094 RepID=A0ACC8XIA1_9FIRM|nr:hypothetical protein AN640_05270 [Epulopiscium sp. SCG-D08WGA-EpuloA1]
MKYNNNKTEDSHLLNIRNCAGYGFDARATNYCPPKAPWWDDGKYPDLEDFGNMYNPWLNPWYGPQSPMPLNEFGQSHHFVESSAKRKKHKDSEFKPYPGEPGYNSGYQYNPYFPYFIPEKEEPKHKKHKCYYCCDDNKDSEFKAYPGEVGYNSGYQYNNPYFPYFMPEKEEPKHKKHKCCCKDDWECADDWFEKHYYGRCNK